MKRLGIIFLVLMKLIFISCATKVKPIPEEDWPKYFTPAQIEAGLEADKEFSKQLNNRRKQMQIEKMIREQITQKVMEVNEGICK